MTTPTPETPDARGRRAECLPFCQGGLHEEGCPSLTPETPAGGLTTAEQEYREALTARIYAARDRLPSYQRSPHNAAFKRDDAAVIADAILSSEWVEGFRRAAAVEQARAEADEAWRVAAKRRSEGRRYYVAWQVARMRARAERRACAEDRARIEAVEALAKKWADEIRLGHKYNPSGHGAISTHERDLDELCAALTATED